MKIALIGATGLVGSVMLKVLEERGFGGCELIPAASSKSVGKVVNFAGREVKVVSVEDAIAEKSAIAIFSAGSGASLPPCRIRVKKKRSTLRIRTWSFMPSAATG